MREYKILSHSTTCENVRKEKRKFHGILFTVFEEFILCFYSNQFLGCFLTQTRFVQPPLTYMKEAGRKQSVAGVVHVGLGVCTCH